ncbi:MAG: hypothetical protein QG610_2336 [Euryarchaeota archaeon]|nr:hypothetical protein [Euryarchaeota archaeon]
MTYTANMLKRETDTGKKLYTANMLKRETDTGKKLEFKAMFSLKITKITFDSKTIIVNTYIL